MNKETQASDASLSGAVNKLANGLIPHAGVLAKLPKMWSDDVSIVSTSTYEVPDYIGGGITDKLVELLKAAARGEARDQAMIYAFTTFADMLENTHNLRVTSKSLLSNGAECYKAVHVDANNGEYTLEYHTYIGAVYISSMSYPVGSPLTFETKEDTAMTTVTKLRNYLLGEYLRAEDTNALISKIKELQLSAKPGSLHPLDRFETLFASTANFMITGMTTGSHVLPVYTAMYTCPTDGDYIVEFVIINGGHDVQLVSLKMPFYDRHVYEDLDTPEVETQATKNYRDAVNKLVHTSMRELPGLNALTQKQELDLYRLGDTIVNRLVNRYQFDNAEPTDEPTPEPLPGPESEGDEVMLKAKVIYPWSELIHCFLNDAASQDRYAEQSLIKDRLMLMREFRILQFRGSRQTGTTTAGWDYVRYDPTARLINAYNSGVDELDDILRSRTIDFYRKGITTDTFKDVTVLVINQDGYPLEKQNILEQVLRYYEDPDYSFHKDFRIIVTG